MRQPILPQLDADTYLLWESRQSDKFELHHGFVMAFAGGTAAHAQNSLNVQTALRQTFPNPCRIFGSDFKIRAAVDSYYYPDASVVCSEISDEATSSSEPRVLVEVLSPSTRAYDLVEKRAAYRAIDSLDAYVIVHTAFRRLEIDVRNGDRSWRTVTVDDGIADVASGRLVLDEVYAGTELAASS